MIKVLVVDDIPDNVKLVALELEEAGYEVFTATNGKEALAILREHGPKIILTDWMMPEMDGMELCRIIRQAQADGAGFAYIVMLTAHADEASLIEAFDAGADDFLSKPFHQPELIARIAAGARIVKLQEELAQQHLTLHKANAELAVLNSKLDELATTDELTGLYNRREAMRQLEGIWDSSIRHGETFSCLLMDIDHFKQFNDTYGHAVGDAVLRFVAQSIQKTCRKGEAAFRVGGEEFLVICPRASESEALLAGERLRNVIASNTLKVDDQELGVHVSVGVATRSDNLNNIDELLALADTYLYAAKEAGRNCVVASTSPSLNVSHRAASQAPS
ncbi:diguanylate cyclase [bacterium AH-315-J04]|nr:diguanylate cyclase [bacterium AH-315-J04]